MRCLAAVDMQSNVITCTAFDKLLRQFEKSSQVIKAEVGAGFHFCAHTTQHVFCWCLQGVPKFYIKVLVDLEDQVATVSRSDTKKMSRSNATGCVNMFAQAGAAVLQKPQARCTYST
jgi:hypothetical protein